MTVDNPRLWGKSPCGTASGYNLHKSRGQRPCDECRLAHNLQTKIGVQAAAAVARLHPETRQAFVRDLQYQHRDRFAAFRAAAAARQARDADDEGAL